MCQDCPLGLHDDSQAHFQVNKSMLLDHWTPLTTSVNYLKITFCTVTAHDSLQFQEQIHGDKKVVGLYLKIIAIFQDFSYLFDEILVLLDRARDWQTGN